MNSTKKFQFKSINVDTDGVRFRSPFIHNRYDELVLRKDLIEAWNEECRIRAAELEIYHDEISDSRDELVQTPDSEARTESD